MSSCIGPITFILQRLALHENEVQFRQQFNGGIRTSLPAWPIRAGWPEIAMYGGHLRDLKMCSVWICVPLAENLICLRSVYFSIKYSKRYGTRKLNVSNNPLMKQNEDIKAFLSFYPLQILNTDTGQINWWSWSVWLFLYNNWKITGKDVCSCYSRNVLFQIRIENPQLGSLQPP